MRISRLLLIVLLAALAGGGDAVWAQPGPSLDPATALTRYRLDGWTSADGLPQNSITALAQDADGYVWLGTQEGLVRFDGTRFRTFDRRDGALANQDVQALLAARDGTLWIATRGGLTRRRDGAFETLTTQYGLPHDHVTALAEDAEGGLWMGTPGAGAARLHGGTVTRLTTADGLPDDHVQTLLAARDGSLWIATRRGLSRHDGAVQTFTSADGLPDAAVTALHQDREGGLWIGTRGGFVLRYDQGRFVPQARADGDVLSLYEDRAGTVWVGTDRAGLSRLREDHPPEARLETLRMDDGLAYDVVPALLEDTEGNLWVGTDGGGLHRLRNAPFTTYTAADGLAHDFVYAIYEDADAALWFATDGGLSRLQDGRFRTYTTADGLASDYVLSVYGGQDGSLWVGTYGAGLSRLRDGQVTHYRAADGLPSDEVYALFEDSQGVLWIGTRQGLGRYHAGRFTTYTTDHGLGSNDVTSIAEDAAGRLWVGTYEGGLHRFEDSRVTRRYTTADGLLSHHVLTLHPDADGTLWIGTREGGLHRLHDGTLAAVGPAQGLFSDTVFQILDDGAGHFWMSCNTGLFRVEKAALEALAAGQRETVTSVAFGPADGLPTHEFNGGFQPAGWRARDGRLWFPTPKGAVALNAPHLTGPAAPFPLHIESVTADGAPLDLSAPARLDPGAGRFVFGYGAVTFAAPERVRYRYRLDGVDAAWVDAGTRREAFYTRLAPGRYTFRVQATDAHGQWGASQAAYTFSLAPFFYQTPLFFILCGLLAALGAFGAYRLRVRQLRARQHELVALVAQHTRRLREEKEKTEQALRETEHARHEAERARHEAEQQGGMAERQKDLAQKARRVIEEQAEKIREMDRTRTRFFNNISHEFRTPLALIIGPLENALTGMYGPLPDAMRQQLELTLRNARRLLRLITQLLDLSKLENDRMELRVRERNITPLLEGVVLSFTAFAEKKDLRLHFDAAREELPVHFDAECMEKVFFNLLSNAVKFTQEGGSIWVTVQETTAVFAEDAAPEPAVVVRVRDTGTGIPEHEIPHIFDRFHQVDGAVGHVKEGTGIGLSLVKELVDLHGGAIDVFSKPGFGTEFALTLPRGAAHFDPASLVAEDDGGDGYTGISHSPMVEMAVFDDDPDGPSPPEGDGFAYPGGDGDAFLPEHLPAPVPAAPPAEPDVSPDEQAAILAVDDNPDVLQYVTASLRGTYHLVTARDGQEALEQAATHLPDVIICDVMMPRMDGYAFCRALKADEALRHIPVILLTAKAAQDDRIEGLEAGADDYMPKPFSARELRARVRNLLEARRQQHELAERNEALRQVSERKSQMLNIAAHDLRNPLTAIREFAQIIKQELGEGTPVKDPLDIIHQSSDDMLRMVGSLLDTSALESGQLALQKAPVNLNTLAASVVRRNKRLAENKGQQLTLSIAADRCLVSADKDRLLEAMDNVVNNAVKYSPLDREIWVTVTRAAQTVRFAVRDQGPGLTDDDKEKLFGQFQRLSAQPTGGESSSGLGLSIVKQVVELHDGQVLVDSTPGEGSTFTLELPLLGAEPPAAAPPAPTWRRMDDAS